MFETDTLNILYGVQATGNGHISRSREIVGALKQRGHRVQVIVSGRPESKLWEMGPLRPYNLFEGLTFHAQAGKVNKIRTVLNAHPSRMRRDINNFQANGIDLVISDFEPISARIARKNSIPSLGIGNQYAFEYPIPGFSSRPLSKMFIQKFTPVDLGIGLHWHHFNSPILPPIIPRFKQKSITNEAEILVYLPFENHADLLGLFRKLSVLNFIIYSNQISAGYLGNIQVKPFSRETFSQDLLKVEGVICNAGFELPSEAISLGKKILVKPLRGQPEQLSNALVLRQLKLGSCCDLLTPEIILDWYKHEKGSNLFFPNIVPELVDWIEAGQWDKTSLGLLSQRLWKGVPTQLKRDKSSHPSDENQSPLRNLKAVLV